MEPPTTPPVIRPIHAIPLAAIKSRVPVRSIKAIGHQFCGQSSVPALTGRVSLVLEPSNPVDPNAIAILEDGVKVSYVAKTHLHWVHALIVNHFSKVRGQEGMHVEEMSYPILAVLIEPDDRGALYGSVVVIGMEGDFGASEGICEATPLTKVPRSCKWLVTLDAMQVGENTPSVLDCVYDEPVSEALVRRYYARKGYPPLSVVPV